ncbi:MAG TPA: dolichyl-phosphate beta-glucosyltransferase [Candidatus Dormibacteraeota bacterium]|nr:dolichyl-phosphate beta-glucosyltransferase [Candidatus Dormibacteraeota bacterium]
MTAPLALTVVIPAFDEAQRLPATLEAIRPYLDARGEGYEVLVVDDGSRDEGPRLVEAAARAWPALRLLRLPENRGKGAAVRAGMLAGAGRWRLFTDADLSTPIAELASLEAACRGGADIAIASRALPGSDVAVHQARHRELMGKTYNRLMQWLVLPGIHDSQCGFKLFTAAAAERCFSQLQCERFGFDAEVLLRARRAGLRVAEVPVRWENAAGTRVNSVRDSAQMLGDLWRLRRQPAAASRGDAVPGPAAGRPAPTPTGQPPRR